MSSYDFIVENITYSYSSTSLYVTCPYSFKLSYIDSIPKVSNFFSEYGTLIHRCMEGYFCGYFDAYELSEYYNSNFSKVVKSLPPPYPAGMEEKYRTQGQSFFDNFSFDKENYEVLLIEKKLKFNLGEHPMVAMPDLVLKNKVTNGKTLFDYKTSTPFWINKFGKEQKDEKKIRDYIRQMLIYNYALRVSDSIEVDKIILWFPRLNKMLDISSEIANEEEAISSLQKTIEKIKADDEFAYNNSNRYFCENLCSVRNTCEFR